MTETDQEQKMRGGFYTPQSISKFLVNWANDGKRKKILEPGCGDGNILLEIGKSLENDAEVTGVELHNTELEKAQKRIEGNEVGGKFNFKNSDFLKLCINENRWQNKSYDAVIGNPPFIRYQNFPKDQQDRAEEILKSSGLKPTRLMNAWMPFLVGSTQLLDDGGRLAMVIPATLLQVKYAGEVREYLSENYEELTVVNFEKLVFDGIQEEVVLLLGVKNSKTEESKINFVELEDETALEEYNPSKIEEQEGLKLDHSKEKWTMYYLNQEELDLIRELRDTNGSLSKVDNYADVNVGVVTGRNAFFVLEEEEAKEKGLMEQTMPLVCRSAHLGDGVIFDEDNLEHNRNEGRRTRLLNLPGEPKDHFSEKIQTYLEHGEEEEYHEGYKLSRRDPWYIVPSTWIPDGFLLRQIHDYPKFVANETDATCTDTIHRVKYTREKGDPEKFVASTHNSLTWLFAEIFGRSYGGGVLELEPNEAEELLIPTENWGELDLQEIDQKLDEEGYKELLDFTDEILLKQGLGLTDDEIHTLRQAWEKMKDRRINRN